MIDDGEEWWGDDDLEPQHWISLSEALDTLARGSKNGYAAAKRDLLELIADGRARLRAQQTFEEADLGSIKLRGIKPLQVHPGQTNRRGIRRKARSPDDPIALPNSFFCRADGWSIDSGRVNWEAATIVATRPTEMRIKRDGDKSQPLTRLVVTGVRLNKQSIENLVSAENKFPADIPIHSPQPEAARTRVKSNRGRPKDPWWGNWIAEVVLHVRMTGFDLEQSNFAFFNEILDREGVNSEEMPEFHTVNPSITAIKTRWRQALNAGELNDKILP